MKPIYLKQKAKRRQRGVPSSDEANSDNEKEDNPTLYDEEQFGDAVVKLERGETPEGVAEGIKIFADDGQRHLSTPTRLNTSSRKRKPIDAAREQFSTSLLRSPLKRRRLNPETSGSEQEDDSSMQEDIDTNELSTQANAAYHKAKPNKGYLTAELLELGQEIYGWGTDESMYESDESEEFETAEPVIKEEPNHASTSEQSDTQGFIDAQILFEMSSAAKRDRSAGSEQGRASPKDLKSGESTPFIPDDEFEESFNDEFGESLDEEEASESLGDSESGESQEKSPAREIERSTPSTGSVVRPPQKTFAPAAFRSSPGVEAASKQSLLPAFASSATPKQPPSDGKGLLQAEQNAKGKSGEATASQSSALEDVLDAAIPAWCDAQLGAGVPAEHVTKAVKATSGALDLAELVIRALAEGKNVPAHIPGIWTDEDDWAIESGGDMMWGNMVRKHGPGIPEERREFLRSWNETEVEPERAD